MNADISVVTPVYNAADHVAAAVESALVQPEVGEVILIEDGSTDDSPARCKALEKQERRVRLIRHDGGANRGAAVSRNAGVAAAALPMIAFLDADDYYLPGRFAVSRPMLRDEALDGVHEAVGTDFATDDARRWWMEEKGRDEVTRLREAVPPDALFDAWLDGDRGAFHTAGVLLRRSAFDRVGGFEPGLRMCQDTHLWIKLAAVCRLAAGELERPVAMRRLHGANRIMTDPDLHARYHLKMARSLLKWSRRRLPAARRGRLADAVVYEWLELHRPAGSAADKLRCLRFAANVAASDPAAARRSGRLKTLLLGRFARPRLSD